MRASPIKRRKSRQIKVGNILIGGDAPIAVQSMTNTLTSNAAATIEQILRMEKVGADIVRVSCPDEESTAALPEIIKNIRVPLVADIHFHYQRGIEAADAGAACLRINPGNIGGQDRVRRGDGGDGRAVGEACLDAAREGAVPLAGTPRRRTGVATRQLARDIPLVLGAWPSAGGRRATY